MISWLGHAAVRLDVRDKVILIDPYDIKDRIRADMVLISHEHFDHCSVEDLRKVAAKRTHLVGPPSTEAVLKRTTKHWHILRAGEEAEIFGLKIKALPAYNIDKPFHPKSAGGLGYLLQADGKSIYFAGDTDLIPEMKDVEADVALLPVGGTYTMGPQAAAEAFRLIGAKEGIPIHYGSVIGMGSAGGEFKRLIAQA